MTQTKIQLTHSSNHPEATGEPGDTITCDSGIASVFIAGGGAIEVKPEPKPSVKREQSKPRTQRKGAK